MLKGILNLLKMGGIMERIKEYIVAQIDLIKEEIKQVISDLIAEVVLFIWITVLLLFMVFFASIAAAFYINHLTETEYLGFFIVTGFYIVLLLFFLLFKKPILRATSRNIYGKFRSRKRD